jgi:hypothetical protein
MNAPTSTDPSAISQLAPRTRGSAPLDFEAAAALAVWSAPLVMVLTRVVVDAPASPRFRVAGKEDGMLKLPPDTLAAGTADEARAE